MILIIFGFSIGFVVGPLVLAIASEIRDELHRSSRGGLSYRLTVAEPLPTCVALPTAWRERR